MTILIQLSDLHIREPGRLAYGRVNTAPFLEAAVASVLALRQPADAVVITGDLVDFGQRAEYQHLARLLAPLTMPVYLMPGNHDDRAQLRAAFPDHGYLQAEDPRSPIQYSVPVGGLQLVALDTVVPGAEHGELCDARLAWLDATLQALQALQVPQGSQGSQGSQTPDARPVVLAMHHPPFETLIGHMDVNGLRHGADALEALLRRHPQVERVICGHLHRAIDRRFGGTFAQTAPAPAHQVSLDLAPDAASSFTMEPPGFRVHAWTPRAGLITHLAPIGPFDGPHPFREPGGALLG